MKEEPRHRLQEARAKAGFPTPTAASRAFRDLNVNTLISYENGNRKISKKASERLARFFGADPIWILFGDRKEPASSGLLRVPMISLVSAGNLRDQPGVTSADIERWVEVADLPAGDWVALGVDGDSMNRIAPDGSTILINRADDRLIDGKFYVFSVEGGQATFKRYKRNPVEAMLPFSTNPEHMATPVTGDLYVFGRARRVITDI